MESESVHREPLSAWLLAMRLDWDVLLSFDSRDGFSAALYSALINRRVRTFKGDETERGPIDAVQDSAAAIAVISSGYADSHSRLEELARFFESNKLVVPVFYRVNPSHVRHGSGPFEQSFQTLQEEHGEEFVTRWKRALKMVGDRSGFVLGEYSDESQIIEKVVKRILGELNKIPIDIAAYPVGLESRGDEVINMLNSKSKAVQFLGIHGQPGIGKTTLAKAVFSRLVPNFKRRCFISNLKETLAKDGGLITIQNKLISDLSLDIGRPSIKDEQSGRRLLMKLLAEDIPSNIGDFHENRVLIVLDDCGAGQLEEIGINKKLYTQGQGSWILSTSRDKDILMSFCDEDELYEAKELIESDALELFSYHALGRKAPTAEFFTLSKEIISLTGGLPLAIEVFGSKLYDKRTTRDWEKSLEKLRRIRPRNLQGVLKLSYDELEEDPKCIFLDISCLFLQVGMKREDAIDIFDGCGFNAEEAIHLLRKKSLLKITRDDVLWMHDQIRDMGRQIVIEEGVDNLRNRSRLWKYNDILYVLKNKTVSDEVRGVIFETGKKRLMVSWDPAGSSSGLNAGAEDSDVISFQILPKLKLLQINQVQFDGDLNNLPTELRWLKWKECPWKSLPSTLPQEIRVLDLSESKLECLWSTKYLLWSNNQVIKNLTVLNLSNNYHLTSIPDLSGNHCMKKLILEGCVKLTKIHKSLGHMKSLVQLNLRRCTSLIEFPRDVSGLIHLEELILSECRALNKLPYSFINLTSLRELHLEETAIKELPSLVHLTRLEYMMLNRCMELKSLPTDVGSMESLKVLSLSGSGVEILPDSIGELRCLEQLKLHHCMSLETIPESVGDLDSLSYLYLTSSSVRTVPGSCCSLPSLKCLSLANCSLETLPTSIGGLSSIVELDLDGNLFHELPHEIGSLHTLQTLKLRKCKSLTRLPESIGDLFSLHVLNLSDSSIVELPDSIGALENLRTLRLNKCKSLAKLPSTFGQLKSLYHLWMEETAVTELPQSIGMLSKLVILKMKKKLPLGKISAELPLSFGNLSMLHEFDARAWNICGQIPENVNSFSHMESLDLGHNSFHSLPSTLQGLSSLRKLLLPHCLNLKLLPPLPSSLTELNVANCSALSRIPDLSNLTSIEELQLTNCDRVQDVAGLEKLRTLRRVYMAGCEASGSAVRRRLSKATYEKLGYLGVPGSQIPNWFSTEPVIFSGCVNARVQAVLIAVILSVKTDSMIEELATSPLSAVQVKIWRAGNPIFTTGLSLTVMPNTCKDQLYLCRFKDFHPLVSLLENGDKLEVSLVQLYGRSMGELVDLYGSSIELKRRGIHVVYENNDTYDGNEDMLEYDQQSVSMKLAGFFQSLC